MSALAPGREQLRMSLRALGSTRAVDTVLRERADRVIPDGMYGHLSVNHLPLAYPQFYRSGSGSRLTDVDGNDYIDFMCAFGPMVLGYAHPAVDEAAALQLSFGNTLGGPSERMVELAELLVDTISYADWALFAKNGTDATSLAVTVARAATGKTKLLKGGTAYHGANAWFSPNTTGIPAEDRANIIAFDFLDLASLEAAVSAADGDVAAIIVAPFMHDLPRGAYQDMVEKEHAASIRAVADRIGAVLILDEVRTGFRLAYGSSWDSLGLQPDLGAYSKAIGNGYAVSALVGKDSLRQAAIDIYSTGSFWFSGVAMAAAIETIRILGVEHGAEHMDAVGRQFMAGLRTQAVAHGFDVVVNGPGSMPFMKFADDDDWRISDAFSNEAIQRGILLHPRHNWFLSAAHTMGDITTALERTDESFAAIRSSL
jgi:glutamate-1-semialdehyde 2,1-aminomutase